MRDLETNFAYNPTGINIGRSKFFLTQQKKHTINAGALIPFYVEEVLPGDTFQVDTGIFARMATPIHPVMDTCYIDYYYFFVPNRLTWSHWEEFNGANSKAWYQTVDYQVPQLRTARYDSGGEPYAFMFLPGSVADNFGLPTLKGFGPVSALPFRAYGLIWNEWFRDQNLQNEVLVPTDDNDRNAIEMNEMTMGHADIYEFLDPGINLSAYMYGAKNFLSGGAPLPVAKLPDYFTTALPSPQKGPNVPLPVEGTASVWGRETDRGPAQLFFQGMDSVGLSSSVEGSDHSERTIGLGYMNENTTYRDAYLTGSFTENVSTSTSNVVLPAGLVTQKKWEELYGDSVRSPLVADISASIGTINDLRLAFAIQRMYERDARGGTRYREIILSHFGVQTGDSRVQIPEFLSGKRVRVGMQQVIQTSATNDVSPQGNTAAFSLTANRSSDFTKSFVEHGYVIGLMCIRQKQSYQQGVNAHWLKRDRFDFYWPALANIGNLPILTQEIFAGSVDITPENWDEEEMGSAQPDWSVYYDRYAASDGSLPFGYKEAWSEYRWQPDIVTGAFRSNLNNWGGSLDSWHYSNHFAKRPTLSNSFIVETPVNIQRTLAVQDEPQFLVDIDIQNVATRPIPIHCSPGLIDHN